MTARKHNQKEGSSTFSVDHSGFRNSTNTIDSLFLVIGYPGGIDQKLVDIASGVPAKFALRK